MAYYPGQRERGGNYSRLFVDKGEGNKVEVNDLIDKKRPRKEPKSIALM